MNKELAKTLTTALVQFIDRERPEGTVCCSSYECERLEKAFAVNNFDFIDGFTRQKLSGLTEFEDRLVAFALQCNGEFDVAREEAAKWSKELLALAKKEPLKDDELGRKHLEGYIMGRNDALREMNDFMESHFNTQSGTSTAKAEG